jgi:hypothetical protein
VEAVVDFEATEGSPGLLPAHARHVKLIDINDFLMLAQRIGQAGGDSKSDSEPEREPLNCALHSPTTSRFKR